ncbi:major facilitator superfamily domain-containing protein [Lophiotrema nucula]|uniref:Major facilitator superfamily domain-containing protein n=1 Tax=Lophiotrema nucula TaxID=690887 RepID=A0A6A5ZSI4_9PLEO|nr:major facilitator superfamily domain-containing protein [Lophiotrema nucula]
MEPEKKTTETDTAVTEAQLPHTTTQTTATDNEKPTAAPATRERTIRGFKWLLVISAILSNLLLYAIDNTIVAVIQPVIVREFGHIQDLPWISVGFLMSGTATALVSGKLFGAFDAKILYILYSLLFLVGSAISGAAPTLAAVIVGRVIGGIGGTGMYLGALTLISVNTTPTETSQYMGYLALVWGFGSVIGPLIGGAFAGSSATWRWGFYINVVIVGVCIFAYLFLLPPYKPQPNTKVSARLKKIDWVGGVISMGALSSLIMVVNFGGTLYAWSSGSMIALITVAGLALIAFMVQQYFKICTTGDLRLLAIELLAAKDMAVCFICQVMVAMIVPIPLYFIPLFFELGKGDSPVRAGVKTLPLIVFWVTSSALRGHLMPRFKWYQSWYIAGSMLNIVAGVLLSKITLDTPDRHIYGFEILSGVGTGCFGQAGFAVAQRLVPKAAMHKAISLMLIAQLSGTTLGLAIGGAIFQNISLSRVRDIVPSFSAEQISGLIAGVADSTNGSLTEMQRVQITTAIATASANCYVVIYAAAAISLVCSLFFTPRKLW